MYQLVLVINIIFTCILPTLILHVFSAFPILFKRFESLLLFILLLILSEMYVDPFLV